MPKYLASISRPKSSQGSTATLDSQSLPWLPRPWERLSSPYTCSLHCILIFTIYFQNGFGQRTQRISFSLLSTTTALKTRTIRHLTHYCNSDDLPFLLSLITPYFIHDTFALFASAPSTSVDFPFTSPTASVDPFAPAAGSSSALRFDPFSVVGLPAASSGSFVASSGLGAPLVMVALPVAPAVTPLSSAAATCSSSSSSSSGCSFYSQMSVTFVALHGFDLRMFREEVRFDGEGKGAAVRTEDTKMTIWKLRIM